MVRGAYIGVEYLLKFGVAYNGIERHIKKLYEREDRAERLLYMYLYARSMVIYDNLGRISVNRRHYGV